jgi:hypothetical protein
MWILYTTRGAALRRNVVRVIDFAQGHGGTTISHDMYLYIFDASLILLVVLAFSSHPSMV